jgi:aspartyl-tRNA(Asn)/glutamyl-tRNA(Gln) amidotransferase subunit B
MINYLKSGKINGKQAKTIFDNIYKTNKTVDQIIKENNLVQITDKVVISEIIKKIADANPQMVAQYKERPDRAEKFFIGQVMKETGGQAKPQVDNECIKEILV